METRFYTSDQSKEITAFLFKDSLVRKVIISQKLSNIVLFFFLPFTLLMSQWAFKDINGTWL